MPTLSDAKTAARRMWALGDYHRFATQLVWSVGPVLVEAAGVRPGMRVLDVAAGTGNVALRAAEAGADVVASDLTPESLEAGRRAAGGLAVEWVEADAEALPFADGEFDVVTSAFGAIFAADQRAVARELQRVCRPGGTIVMANFTPEGLAGEFFATLARHAPAPAGPSPLAWGEEAHVRALLAGAECRSSGARTPRPCRAARGVRRVLHRDVRARDRAAQRRARSRPARVRRARERGPAGSALRLHVRVPPRGG